MSTKTPINKDTEKQLIPRLRNLGFILLFFSVFTLCYALISNPYPALPQEEISNSPEGMEAVSGIDEPTQITVHARLDFFTVATIFACVGTGCILIAWRKKKQNLLPECEK